MDKKAINMEQFGSFITKLRGEKGLTQKQLAEKLFISNKAVSKWERGLSMPDIALLEPLAEILGVTVLELLHGQRQAEGILTEDEIRRTEGISAEDIIRQTDSKPETVSEESLKELRERKKKRGWLYLLEWFLAVAQVLLLYLFGRGFGISWFDVSLDMLILLPLVLFFGAWAFFGMPEKLPAFYDVYRISYFSDGFFQISVPGVYFNNRNWPHIVRAFRGFCFLMPICWPAAYFLIRLVIPGFVWLFGRIVVLLVLMLGGLFIPIVVVGREYGDNPKVD